MNSVLLRKPQVHYRARKSLSQIPILSHINLIPSQCLLEILREITKKNFSPGRVVKPGPSIHENSGTNYLAETLGLEFIYFAFVLLDKCF